MGILTTLAREDTCELNKVMQFKSPGLDETVYVRMISAHDFLAILRKYENVDTMTANIESIVDFLALVLCDVDGNLLFENTPDKLHKLPMSILQDLFNQGFELIRGSKGLDAVKND